MSISILGSKSKNNLFLGLFIIITIIFLIAMGPYLKLHFIVTNGMIPALFALAFFIDLKSINKNNTEFIWLALIFIGGLFSVFYLKKTEIFVSNLNSFFGAVLSAYIALALNKSKNYSNYFHVGFILSIFLLVAIMYKNGNFSFTNFANIVDFRDRFMLNANAYSYFSFFGNFSLFLLHHKYKSKFTAILLLALPLLFLIISFVTLSRSGLLFIILINLIYWTFINVPEKNNKAKKLLRKLVVILLIVVLGIKFLDIYQGSRIQNRVQGSVQSSEDPRGLLIVNSLKVFVEHPIFGVGLGQVRVYNGHGQFSHNSYVEILAEQGIVGGFMLFLLFGIPLKKSWYLFRKRREDPLAKIFLMFFVTFYMYNNFYVFYKFPFAMMYFFLIISLMNKLYTKTKAAEPQRENHLVAE